MDSVLLVGFDVQKEVPLLAHRIRKATNKGAAVHALNPQDFGFSFDVANVTDNADEAKTTLEAIAKIALAQNSDEKYTQIKNALADSNSDMAEAIVKSLSDEKTVILLGQHALANGEFSYIYALSKAIADLTNSEFGLIDAGSNAAGAWATNCLNNDSALSGAELVNNVSGIILSGLDLTGDSAQADEMLKALDKSEFVLSLSSFMDEASMAHADIILPIGAFTETAGTYVNMQGDWQSFTGVLAPKGEARPAWKVLRVLSNKLAIGGFDFISSDEVLSESKADIKQNTSTDNWQLPTQDSNAKPPLAVANIYNSDALVRRAAPLQATVLSSTGGGD
jgi:NADH-quinone oxidoreductase subunit G